MTDINKFWNVLGETPGSLFIDGQFVCNAYLNESIEDALVRTGNEKYLNDTKEEFTITITIEE